MTCAKQTEPLFFLFAEKATYSCTKCCKKFSAIEKLHAHILDCASAGKAKTDTTERTQPKHVFKKGLGRISIQAKKVPSTGQMKLKAAIGYQKKVSCIIRPLFLRLPQNPQSQAKLIELVSEIFQPSKALLL